MADKCQSSFFVFRPTGNDKDMVILLIASTPVPAWSQTRPTVLSGKVIDADDGYPLIGVAVMVSATKYGTVTDADGNFELTIPDKESEIVFSYIGYDDFVKDFNGRHAGSFSTIVMKVNATQLADVVVIETKAPARGRLQLS